MSRFAGLADLRRGDPVDARLKRVQTGVDPCRMIITDDVARLPHQQNDSSCGDQQDSPLVRRRELLRRLHACAYLRRLAAARMDLAATTALTTAELLAAARLAPEVDRQAQLILTAPAPAAGLFELSLLLHRLTEQERELRDEADALTGQVVEQLRRCPDICRVMGDSA